MSRTDQLSAHRRAAIIGGSVAGLCAARVLADHFDEVTLIERDDLPEQPVNRNAVPQGQHVHLLMARGAEELERLFPGLLDDMSLHGVPVLADQPSGIHFAVGGHELGIAQARSCRFTAYLPSRGQLEWQLRNRVRALPGVQILKDIVTEPRYDADARAVTGLRLADGDDIVADLVVDASGRGSRLPNWLPQWGFDPPREDTLKVGVTYASHRVRIPDGLITEKMVLASASNGSRLGMGMLFHEDGIWTVTCYAVAKHDPPTDFATMCTLSEDILPPHVAAALRAGEPVGEMKFHRYPTSKWRRYDKLTRMPDGIMAFGDAVASMNPTFGQGVTMTALQARNLRTVMAKGLHDVTGRFARSTARSTFPVWTMNTIADLEAHGAEGDRRWWYGPMYGLFDQFLGAAESDPVLAEWFLRRTSLLDGLYLAPSPRLIGRAMRDNVRSWWASRSQAQQTTPEPPVVAAEG